MTDFIDDVDAEEWAEFERLGRRAGAELRTAPPDRAIEDLERTVRRRATTRVVAGTVVVVALAAVGWFVTRGHIGSDDTPVDQTPVPTVPLPVGEAGTWRVLAEPATVPTRVSSAAWTGTEVFLLGVRFAGTLSGSAAAYDVRADLWRSLAPPPEALLDSVRTAWTGSALLAVGARGEVFTYEPIEDRWNRIGSPENAAFEDDALAVVSSRGVLARSTDGWWWYDASTDSWSSVPSPDPSLDTRNTVAGGAMLDTLSPTSFVLAAHDAGRTAYSVFDAESGKWARTRAVEGPTVTRGGPSCLAADGRLVCMAEGYGTLDGIVIDVEDGTTSPFSLDHGASLLTTSGTPWFGHAWSLLLARTAAWEALPPLDDVDGFFAAIWNGRELLMFGGQLESGEPGGHFAAAYTPVVQP